MNYIDNLDFIFEIQVNAKFSSHINMNVFKIAKNVKINLIETSILNAHIYRMESIFIIKII